MRKLLFLPLLLCSLCLAFSSSAQTNTVNWNFGNYLGVNPSSVVRISVNPIPPYPIVNGVYLIPDPIVFTRSANPGMTNGVVTTNVYLGVLYRVEYAGYQTLSKTNYFPTTITNTVNASDYDVVDFSVLNNVFAVTWSSLNGFRFTTNYFNITNYFNLTNGVVHTNSATIISGSTLFDNTNWDVYGTGFTIGTNATNAITAGTNAAVAGAQATLILTNATLLSTINNASNAAVTAGAARGTNYVGQLGQNLTNYTVFSVTNTGAGITNALTSGTNAAVAGAQATLILTNATLLSTINNASNSAVTAASARGTNYTAFTGQNGTNNDMVVSNALNTDYISRITAGTNAALAGSQAVLNLTNATLVANLNSASNAAVIAAAARGTNIAGQFGTSGTNYTVFSVTNSGAGITNAITSGTNAALGGAQATLILTNATLLSTINNASNSAVTAAAARATNYTSFTITNSGLLFTNAITAGTNAAYVGATNSAGSIALNVAFQATNSADIVKTNDPRYIFANTNIFVAGANITLSTNAGAITIASTGGSATNAIGNTNGFGTNTTVQGFLSVGGGYTFIITTNIIGISNSIAHGTYQLTSVGGIWTNVNQAGYSLNISGGVLYAESNTVPIFANSTGSFNTTNWSIVGAPGAVPTPVSYQGWYLQGDGGAIIGYFPLSTNLIYFITNLAALWASRTTNGPVIAALMQTNEPSRLSTLGNSSITNLNVINISGLISSDQNNPHAITITGASDGGGSNNGGDVNFIGGTGNFGGNVNIQPGPAVNSDNGNLNLTAPKNPTGGIGGNIRIATTNHAAGITIVALDGNVNISAPTGTVTIANGNFSGNGAGITNLSFTNITGQVALAALTNAGTLWTNGIKFAVTNSGVGITNDIVTSSNSVLQSATNFSATLASSFAQQATNAGNLVFQGLNATNLILVNARVDATNPLVFPHPNGILAYGDNFTNVVNDGGWSIWSDQGGLVFKIQHTATSQWTISGNGSGLTNVSALYASNLTATAITQVTTNAQIVATNVAYNFTTNAGAAETNLIFAVGNNSTNNLMVASNNITVAYTAAIAANNSTNVTFGNALTNLLVGTNPVAPMYSGRGGIASQVGLILIQGPSNGDTNAYGNYFQTSAASWTNYQTKWFITNTASQWGLWSNISGPQLITTTGTNNFNFNYPATLWIPFNDPNTNAVNSSIGSIMDYNQIGILPTNIPASSITGVFPVGDLPTNTMTVLAATNAYVATNDSFGKQIGGTNSPIKIVPLNAGTVPDAFAITPDISGQIIGTGRTRGNPMSLWNAESTTAGDVRGAFNFPTGIGQIGSYGTMATNLAGDVYMIFDGATNQWANQGDAVLASMNLSTNAINSGSGFAMGRIGINGAGEPTMAGPLDYEILLVPTNTVQLLNGGHAILIINSPVPAFEICTPIGVAGDTNMTVNGTVLAIQNHALFGVDRNAKKTYVELLTSNVNNVDDAGARHVAIWDNLNGGGIYLGNQIYTNTLVGVTLQPNTGTNLSISIYNANLSGPSDQKFLIISTNFGTFLGLTAGVNNRTTASAGGNTGIGNSALNALTTGGNNTAIGLNALVPLVAGGDNTAVGKSAGGNAIVGNGNVLIGEDTGWSGLGNNNTLIGTWAGFDQTSGAQNIIIGAYCDAASLSGSGQLNIGNVIYGNGMYNTGGGTPSSTAQAGTVQIGTSTAAGTGLTVQSNITTVAGQFFGNGAGLTNLATAAMPYRSGLTNMPNLATAAVITFSIPLNPNTGTNYMVEFGEEGTFVSTSFAYPTAKTTNGFTLNLTAGIAGGGIVTWSARPFTQTNSVSVGY